MPKTIKTLSVWSFIAFFLSLVFYYFFFAYSLSRISVPDFWWICAFLVPSFILLMLAISLHHLAKTAGTADYTHSTEVAEINKKIEVLQTELADLKKEVKEANPE